MQLCSFVYYAYLTNLSFVIFYFILVIVLGYLIVSKTFSSKTRSYSSDSKYDIDTKHILHEPIKLLLIRSSLSQVNSEFFKDLAEGLAQLKVLCDCYFCRI